MLANATGGLALRETNDLDGKLQRVLDDQQGYYLPGYRQDETTFTANDNGCPRFHRNSTRVERKGLSARRPHREHADGAALSFLRLRVIPLGMTATFYRDAYENLFLHAVVHNDASGVTFQDAGGGARIAELEVATIIFGE